MKFQSAFLQHNVTRCSSSTYLDLEDAEPDADDIDEYSMDGSGKCGWLVELVSTSEFPVSGV